MEQIREKLQKLYPGQSEELIEKINEIISGYRKKTSKTPGRARKLFSERDVILICYADHVQEPGLKTFKTMHKFLHEQIGDAINKVHFLPFYPWSSDDGFSVMDYYKVHEPYGDWEDIKNIGQDFGFMFDCVANHMSARSEWFQKALSGDPKYEKYFIGFSEAEYKKNQENFARVFRPRKHPLLTKFQTANGIRYYWTTFSEDQVDLNFANQEVFLEILKILLFYISHGAEAIRLDAIAYAWKKLGTNCFDLPEAHTLVQIYRAILKKIAPQVWLITETVLPHHENINYFGDGHNEAHLVYHFQLEALLLYTMLKEDSSIASEWLKSVKPKSRETSFLNLSVSHDGIHTIPAYKILNTNQMSEIAQDCEKKGGRILERDAGGGRHEIYEMNITYPSAVGGVEKYLASQAIQLSLQGVPLIYLNNLIGAENWQAGVEKLGYSRAINREKFDYQELTEKLNNSKSKMGKIFQRYKKLLKIRINETLFSPLAEQEIIALDSRIMAIKRFDKQSKLLALINISSQEVRLAGRKIQSILQKAQGTDLISKQKIDLKKDLICRPHQVYWIK